MAVVEGGWCRPWTVGCRKGCWAWCLGSFGLGVWVKLVDLGFIWALKVLGLWVGMFGQKLS